MTDANVLSVERLVLDYRLPRQHLLKPAGKLRAVDGIDLSVARGRALGLVGESGCGKSSVARTVVGLERPTSGAVRILGKDISALSRKALQEFRRHFQMVFQDPYGSLNPRHSVGRIVAEPISGMSGRDARARVEEVLQAVGLKATDAEKYPHEFSGGQRQRIAIARALVTRPALVVADEPVSALDVSVQAQVLNLFKELQKAYGLTYLFISHDLAVVEYVCDEIAVMFAGRIVERGSARTVLNAPLHPFTAALREAMPRLDGKLRRRASAEQQPAEDNRQAAAGCAYAQRCPLAEPRCRSEAPKLESKRRGHWAACHLVNVE